MGNATLIMKTLQTDDAAAAGQLLALVYEELRRIAAFKMAQESPGHTLQPTALVHEAWLRIMQGGSPRFENRTHFFAVAAEAMRRILIDRARRKRAVRHGGKLDRVDLEEFDLAVPDADDQMLAVSEALDRLAAEHPVQAEVVKLRYFVGLTNEEIGQLLDISGSTVKNYWVFARAWLFREINGGKAGLRRSLAG